MTTFNLPSSHVHNKTNLPTVILTLFSDTKNLHPLYIYIFSEQSKHPSFLSLHFPCPFLSTTFPFPSLSPMALLHSLFALPFLLLSLQLHTSSCALLLSLRHHHNTLHQQRPMIHANQTNCALFVGTWVQDDSYPIYQSSNCPIIDPQFNCKMFGRPDSDYLRYRWRPLNCDLPRYPQKLKTKTFLTNITFLLFTKTLQVSSENGVCLVFCFRKLFLVFKM